MEQWVVPQGAVYSNKTNLLFFYLERLWLFTLGCVCLPCPWRLISQRPRHSLKFNVGVKGSRKDGAALQQTGCFLSPLIVHGECWSPSQHFSGAKVGCSSDKSAVRQRGPTQRDTTLQQSNGKKKIRVANPWHLWTVGRGWSTWRGSANRCAAVLALLGVVGSRYREGVATKPGRGNNVKLAREFKTNTSMPMKIVWKAGRTERKEKKMDIT